MLGGGGGGGSSGTASWGAATGGGNTTFGDATASGRAAAGTVSGGLAAGGTGGSHTLGSITGMGWVGGGGGAVPITVVLMRAAGRVAPHVSAVLHDLQTKTHRQVRSRTIKAGGSGAGALVQFCGTAGAGGGRRGLDGVFE